MAMPATVAAIRDLIRSQTTDTREAPPMTTDPNQTLARIRSLLDTYSDTIDAETANDAASFLVEAVVKLDDHLSAGGTPPEAWREGPDAPTTDDTPGYRVIGWTEETDLDNDDDRPGVYFLTIADPDGEEYAVIMHRVCGGKFPLDGEVARAKERQADHIVAALNA